MDTAPLKSFATASRTELIREVGARITGVLAQGSPERVEQPNAVAALERAIAGAGGGDKGKTHVADKVAYTWFNRLIALRFMDANGYTGIGVVSPATDHVGQPEVLAAAKRGQLDARVVNGTNPATIAGLLNGTRQPRPGVDAQAEAYALLLADYCRFWHGTMPFMFEREGDYTELLIPANLLAEDSVLSRSVSVLTQDVCRDVEVIGWLYQYYISERKDEVFAGFKKNKKAGADEIPAATQLFTPHWIVRYLVENSLGRLWMLNHPESRLVEQMDYYIAPVDEETGFLKISKPEELKVIDPACGSGHMLTYAFDLLYAIYEEEGYAPSEIPGLILINNLYGTEIDPRAGALAAFALSMKAASKRKLFLKNPVEPNVCVLEPITFSADELKYLVSSDGDRLAEEAFWNQFAEADTFGSLIKPDQSLLSRLARHLETVDHNGDMYRADALDWARHVIRQAEVLCPRYSVVVANPPYMGTRNMSDQLREFAEETFEYYSGDLCTMFIDRSLELVDPGGLAALVVSESWLFNTTYEDMRRDVVRSARPAVTACIDKAAFGVRLNTAATVFERSTVRSQLTFFRVTQEDLVGGAVDALPPRNAFVYKVDFRHFENVPGKAFIFDMPNSMLALYKETRTLGDLFEVKQGLATADNAQFVRFWWEVSRDRFGPHCSNRQEALQCGKRWFPYNKGGTPVPWWGNQDHVVNWEQDGVAIRSFGTEDGGRPRSAVRNPDFYFREAVTWSNIGSGGARFRLIPAGFVFDVAGMSLFANTSATQYGLLGYLNSTIVRAGLDVLAPTLNYQVGDVARLPAVLGDDDNERVERLVELTRSEWSENETAYEFGKNPLVDLRRSDLKAATGALHGSQVRRGTEIGELEQLSDEYWGKRISEASGVPMGERFAHSPRQRAQPTDHREMQALVSYSVGCMFGRYSLDEPGLILADQGATLQDYLAKVPSPTLAPDVDNVIPIVDGDWFEDDVVGLFRRFLRTAFGDQHLEENLKFITESLGVKNLRDYFITRAGKSKFYDDHVQRYKKRPIYWLFSSPRGSFNALIYMHRYTPSTVSTVLTYLREYVTKLESALQQAERAGNAKEADRLRKILLELNEYEHDTLYPKASENVVIDLDDGVKANYPKFGAALRRIPGLEAPGD